MKKVIAGLLLTVATASVVGAQTKPATPSVKKPNLITKFFKRSKLAVPQKTLVKTTSVQKLPIVPPASGLLKKPATK